jgi:hypothetical protein
MAFAPPNGGVLYAAFASPEQHLRVSRFEFNAGNWTAGYCLHAPSTRAVVWLGPPWRVRWRPASWAWRSLQCRPAPSSLPGRASGQ